MRAVVLSDVHITGLPGDVAQDSLVAYLDGLAVEVVYLLGDLFHAGWAWAGGLRAGYAPILGALDRLQSRGIKVCFVPGNHDFAVGPALRTRGVEVATSFSIEVGGRRLLLVHGDEADRSAGYRFTTALLRGRPFAALMERLGPVRGDALLDRLAGASRGRPAPRAPLIAAQADWARRQWADGADIVVMGHIHHFGLLQEGGKVLVYLGDWVEKRSRLVIDGERLYLDGPVVVEVG